MKRKDFLRLGLPAFLLLANGQILSAEEAIREKKRRKVKLRFVVASDGHYGQPKTDYVAYHQTLVKRINEEHAKNPFAFCVINGDVVHDDISHYPAVKAIFDQLAVKYYVSQGNHDMATPQEWEQAWKMPVNMDFKIGKQAVLIASTSNKEGKYLPPDTAWMKARLEEHQQAENVFIFIHINPAGIADHSIQSAETQSLFAQHKNIRAVFNGHDHNQDGVHNKDGVNFLFDAHFGGSWGTGYRGFRVVELLKDNSLFTYLMNPIEIIHERALPSPG